MARRPHRTGMLLAALLGCVIMLAGVVAASPASTQRRPPPPPPAVAGAPSGGESYYPTDGNGGYQVLDYRVKIRYNPDNHHLDGDTSLTAAATQRLRSFNLDLSRLTVHAVRVDGRSAHFTRTGAHELVITPAAPLAAHHRFTVQVGYGGIPRAQHGHGWQYSVSGGAFVAGEPHAAAEWYPVNDIPRDKATFHLVATVPDGWSVIANGIQGKRTEQAGWTTFRWNENTPVASYLTTVGIDHWTWRHTTLADGTPVVSAFAPGAQAHQADESKLPQILAFLESKFGPYPQDAAGGIFVADNIAFSLETQTRPIYGQWAGVPTIVHENAHQWFGDSVSINGWRDICLNECFASYAQSMWAEATQGVNLDAVYRRDVAATRHKPGFWAQRLDDPGPGKEFTGVYTKGAMAIHALRRQLGERAFDHVLRGWPARYRHGNASWPQFERFVEQVSGEQLKGFFDAWFRGTTIPEPRYLWPGTLHP